MSNPLCRHVQNYLRGRHWRKLIFFFEAKLCAYMEPYGNKMRASDAVYKAFTKANAMEGWSFKSVQIQLQTDGYNCGAWIVVLDEAIIDYVGSPGFGAVTFDAFSTFLAAWLKDRDVSNLFAVARAQLGDATALNEKFITDERDGHREALSTAAAAGKLEDYRKGSRYDTFAGKGNAAADG